MRIPIYAFTVVAIAVSNLAPAVAGAIVAAIGGASLRSTGGNLAAGASGEATLAARSGRRMAKGAADPSSRTQRGHCQDMIHRLTAPPWLQAVWHLPGACRQERRRAEESASVGRAQFHIGATWEGGNSFAMGKRTMMAW